MHVFLKVAAALISGSRVAVGGEVPVEGGLLRLSESSFEIGKANFWIVEPMPL